MSLFWYFWYFGTTSTITWVHLQDDPFPDTKTALEMGFALVGEHGRKRAARTANVQQLNWFPRFSLLLLSVRFEVYLDPVSPWILQLEGAEIPYFLPCTANLPNLLPAPPLPAPRSPIAGSTLFRVSPASAPRHSESSLLQYCIMLLHTGQDQTAEKEARVPWEGG